MKKSRYHGLSKAYFYMSHIFADDPMQCSMYRIAKNEIFASDSNGFCKLSTSRSTKMHETDYNLEVHTMEIIQVQSTVLKSIEILQPSPILHQTQGTDFFFS